MPTRSAPNFVATGHYARVQSGPNGDWTLRRGNDATKDQSYVLFGIEPTYLPRMLLPVGGHCKTEIRAIAADLGLRVAHKRDSQEICFVTEGHHSEFVAARRFRETRGEFVDMAGRVLGQHDGIERFTVGQRKGLGIALGTPHFVIRIDADTCRVVLGETTGLGSHTSDGTASELACHGAWFVVFRTSSNPVQQSRGGCRRGQPMRGGTVRSPVRRAMLWRRPRSGGRVLRRGPCIGWRLDRIKERIGHAIRDRPQGFSDSCTLSALPRVVGR